jgi:hypothetical protein
VASSGAVAHRDARVHAGYDAVMRTVRTTVAIEESVLRDAKELAQRTHRSLGDVVTEALAMVLAHDRKQPRAQGRVELPVFDGKLGLRPGVDLEDKDALYELLDMPDLDPEDLTGDGSGAADEERRRAAG